MQSSKGTSAGGCSSSHHIRVWHEAYINWRSRHGENTGNTRNPRNFRDTRLTAVQWIPGSLTLFRSTPCWEPGDEASLLPKSASWEEEPFMEVTEVVVLTQEKVMLTKKAIDNLDGSLLYICCSQKQETPRRYPRAHGICCFHRKGSERLYGGHNWLAYDYNFRQKVLCYV